MKCIILAAGYATRLYPLTEHTPKPLLDIAGRSILDRIIDKVDQVSQVDEIIVVSNHKFYQHFLTWKQTYQGPKQITVINDGSTTNETRLGAINDILFSIESCHLQEDLLVLAGDNLFDFELTDFVHYFQSVHSDVMTTHILDDIDQLRRTGVAELDSNQLLIGFEEKPKHPKTTFAVPPFYIYKNETIPLIKQFIQDGNNGDAPGMLLRWLLQKTPIHAFVFQGERYDVGTLETYHEVNQIFNSRKNNESKKG